MVAQFGREDLCIVLLEVMTLKMASFPSVVRTTTNFQYENGTWTYRFLYWCIYGAGLRCTHGTQRRAERKHTFTSSRTQ